MESGNASASQDWLWSPEKGQWLNARNAWKPINKISKNIILVPIID